MMNGQWPARCGHLIPVHLTAHGSTGRFEVTRVERVDCERGERKEDTSGLFPSLHLAVIACHHGITVRTETAGHEWTPMG
jgi:hypothetical protein